MLRTVPSRTASLLARWAAERLSSCLAMKQTPSDLSRTAASHYMCCWLQAKSVAVVLAALRSALECSLLVRLVAERV